MIVQIQQEPLSALADYACVSSAFEVSERFAIVTPNAGLGGLHLHAERVVARYVKDYDAEPGQHPTTWPARFDLARWGILTAWADGRRLGGAVIAWDTPGVEMLDGRSDLAVLWDLRVLPDWRRRGVGTSLFRAAEEWMLARGVHWLKIETQNVNVTACRFYARQGCTLGAVHRFAYPTLPDEAQLLWYKPLGSGRGAG